MRSSFAAVMCFASCAAHAHAILHKAPAEDSAVGWERQSHPIGCGYFGANVFGRVDDERVQVTHNAVLKPDPKQARMAVLTDALEVSLETDEKRPQTWTLSTEREVR